MLSVARICRSLPVAKAALFNASNTASRPTPLRTTLWRNFSNDGRDPFSRTSRRRRTLKEVIMQPTQGTRK